MEFLDKNQMFQIFLEEALDSLSELSNYLLALEKNKDDKEAIQIIFRSAHTLKGNSSTVYNTFYDASSENIDFRLQHTNNLALVTHALENLIMEARDNDMPLTEQHIDILFETEQMLETLLYYIETESENSLDIEPIRQRLLEAVETNDLVTEITTSKTTDITEIIDNKEKTITLRFDTELEAEFMVPCLPIVYNEIEDKYTDVTFKPSLTELEELKEISDILATFSTTDSIETALAFVKDVSFVVNVQYIGEDTESPHSIAQTTLPLSKEETPTPSPTPPSQQPDHVITNTSLRVPLNRIDEVLKHVSSLVILRNKLMNIIKKVDDKNLFDVSDEMSQSIDFLQESVMNIRMTPLDHLFGRFPKDVRNIAKEYNKKVNFECIGGETEIDKSLLDELGKPLIHLIRNSLFHGIESEEERIKVGKNPVGLLRISAKHEQNMVVLTVEDDGKGIDAEAVKRKAIEKGLLTTDKIDKVTKEEIINYIFHPGLSTSDTINSVAGRGVGMDAVRATVENMKGHIEVQSVKGKGTKTIINLPLTLAIIPAMLTKIEGEYFSIPISQVIEAVEVNGSDMRYVANKEVYILREKEIPIIHLKDFFQLSSGRSKNDKLKIVILKSGNKTIGVTVDEFVELEDIVVKNIGEYLGNIRGIAGCNILGDGSISLIVDVNTLTNAKKTTSQFGE